MPAPSVGLTEIVNRIMGITAGATPYVAVGSGTNPFADGDTVLQTELASGRVLASTVTVAANAATIKAFFNTAQANGTIAETGLLTASSVGVLMDRSPETPTQAKTADKEMIVEYTVTVNKG